MYDSRIAGMFAVPRSAPMPQAIAGPQGTVGGTPIKGVPNAPVLPGMPQPEPGMYAKTQAPPPVMPPIAPGPNADSTFGNGPIVDKPQAPPPVMPPRPANPNQPGQMSTRERLARAIIGRQQEVNHPLQAIGNAAAQMAGAYADRRFGNPAMRARSNPNASKATMPSQIQTIQSRMKPRGY